MRLPSLTVVVSLAVVSHCLPPETRSATQLLRRTSPDPSDLSWIKTWASVGDSFSTGIGAGNKNGGWGDYFCSRYDASFPAIINTDPRLGSSTGRTFTYWPCSGATTDDVINQVGGLASASQDLITITSGGNDADLIGILNECVFQWLSAADPLNSKCQDQLSKAQTVIDSDDFHSKLDKLISTAKSKLKPGGHIYYVGYAQYFGTDDDQCDSVTWSFWYEIGKREYLTTDKRTKMNTLVQNMNNALSDAVGRAGSSVTFIDYDKYYTAGMGRFCEKDYPESNPNRYGLLFYEWDTDDNKPETDGEKALANSPPLHVTPGLVMNGTFHAAINDYIKQMHAQNPSWGSNWTTVDGSLPHIESLNATKKQLLHGTSSNLVPDGYAKVFHPRPNGHQLIANLVLYHIEANYAKKLNQAWPPEEITSDTCAPLKPLPPPSSPKSQSNQHPPQPSCNKAFDGHTDTDEWAQGELASEVCDKAKNDEQMIKQGDPSSNIHEVLYYQSGDNAWIYDVSWKDGCTSDVTKRSAWNPMGASYNCTSLFVRDFKQCNNGGVGGNVTVGCVTYGFSVGAKYDVGN